VSRTSESGVKEVEEGRKNRKVGRFITCIFSTNIIRLIASQVMQHACSRCYTLEIFLLKASAEKTTLKIWSSGNCKGECGWKHLVHDKDQRRVLVNTIINFRIQYKTTNLAAVTFTRATSVELVYIFVQAHA